MARHPTAWIGRRADPENRREVDHVTDVECQALLAVQPAAAAPAFYG